MADTIQPTPEAQAPAINSPDNPILSKDDTTANVTAPAPTDPSATTENTQDTAQQQPDMQKAPLDNKQSPMGPTAQAPAAPPVHPAIQKAGLLHTIAETLAGGPRFKTNIDVNTGEVTRTKLPMSSGSIAMAIAMEAIGGALGGLTVHGPDAAAQAAEKGFQAGQANRQKELDQDKQQADETYTRQMALTQTNFRMHQNAVQMGQQDYDFHQQHVDNYKSTYETLLKLPGAVIADMVPESDLTKYHVTKDTAIPVATVARLDPKTGEQIVDKYGVKQWDNMYAVVNPDASMAMPPDVLKTLADYNVPGYSKSDGSPISLGANPMAKARLVIDGLTKAAAIKNAEGMLNKAQDQVANPSSNIYSLFPDLNGLADAITAHEGGRPGDRNTRNNNPGNLKFRNQLGATEDKDGFAVFKTADQGRNALVSQLKGWQAQSPFESTESFTHRYSPDSDPGNGPGTEKTYADALYKAAGKAIPEKATLNPVDLKAEMKKDPFLINALEDYAKYSGSPIDEAVKKMEADKTINPSSVGKIVQLVGGQQAIQKVEENRKQAETTAAKQIAAETEVAKVHAEAEQKKKDQEGDDDSFAKSLADGDLVDLKTIATMRGDRREGIEDKAKALNPNYIPGMVDTKTKVIDDFMTDQGKSSQQMKSANTLFDHIGKAIDASNQYTRTNSPLLNKPLNWWAENASNDPMLQQLRSAIEPVKTEFMTFLGNNHALTEKDKQTGDILASEKMTPAALFQNLKTFAETAAYRLKETNNTFRRAFENHNFPGLLSPDAAEGISKLTDSRTGKNPTRDVLQDMDVGGFITGNSKGYGTPGQRLGDVVKTGGNANWQPPKVTNPANSPQGKPDGAKLVDKQGNVVAVAKGGQWTNPQQ